jgi:riboflavin kinase/FMN adenylyltransferase
MNKAMKLLRHWQQLQNLPPSVLTIGNFDGVHRGHQTILRRMLDLSRSQHLVTVVMLFEPQPQEFFQGANAPARLMHWREKVEALRDLDIDYVLIARFNDDFRALTAQQFVDQVIAPLNCQHLVIGDDFHFGCDRTGDVNFLRQAGLKAGFVVESTSTIAVGDERVSSTRIRCAIRRGDFALAERLLGRPFSIAGHVKHGDKIGRTLDFPTANISLKRQVSPLAGIYTVKVWGLDDKPLLGAANVGTRPAVNGKENRIEVHLLDFQGDIYGRLIRVQFCHKLRDETNFPSLDALKVAIANDVQATREYFS